MALTHVCEWDPKIGYRRISIGEACSKFPRSGVAASRGFFVCELCAQNVLLTAPGGINVRHFRHDPNSPNKECDERQRYFDPMYGRSIRGLNSYEIPLHLTVTVDKFDLKLGFFYPPSGKPYCEKIKITAKENRRYEYSFERIERTGTTYLSVGNFPSQHYKIEYINANAELKRFWSSTAPGVNPTGAFFDGRTGRLLQPGGKAYAGNTYYLLQKGSLLSYQTDVEVTEISRVQSGSSMSWHLYRIRVKQFSAHSARFFLKRSIFLTEKPTKFYPIWPPYIEDSCFIYHSASEFYFYTCGDDAEIKSFPATAKVYGTQNGKLYKLYTREKEQLVSFGKSGALGFSYLLRRPLNKNAEIPSIIVTDQSGNPMTEDNYNQLPNKKMLSVSCLTDGKAVVRRDGRVECVYKLSYEQSIVIDGLTFGTEVILYQGCDHVRSIRFEKQNIHRDEAIPEDLLLKKLNACSEPMIPVTHSIGTLANRYSSYPKIKQWVLRAIRRGEMSAAAYHLLQTSSYGNE